ncbi:MAG: PAS domain-containing protein [Anaerolineae bacterium]|nr:PAS domain-containing protein [Anaerolineae bacterium]
MKDKNPYVDSWQRELLYFVVLAVLGVAASYFSINIPYTEALIEGRWIFGYIGFVFLSHGWVAFLLACVLSIARPYQLPLLMIFIGNMLYAFPTLLLMRVLNKYWLSRLRSLVWYGVAWLLVILLCYQLFTTPVVWGFLAYLNGRAIWSSVLEGWRIQPFFFESVLVSIITALVIVVIRSNRALRVSRQELVTTLYSIGDGVIATDTNGLILRMNPVAETLTGWREAAAIGKPLTVVFSIINEETGEVVANPVNRVLKEGVIVGLANHTLLVARDGTERPIVDSAAPIRGEDGVISGVVLIFRDQTRERATQKALMDSYRQMTQILTTVPAGVLLLDAGGRILQANPIGEEDLELLAGVGVGEILAYLGSSPLSSILTPPTTEGLWHEINVEGRTFEVIARPVESDPQPEHWVLVINDVTREREVRMQLQQQERLAAVGQLAAGIAHDFNNIMAVIVLYARMIERSEDLSSRDRERLAVITQQAWHASKMIVQILDFSRRGVLERQLLDLLPLLKEQLKLLERTLPEHIKIELVYTPDTYTVNADPTRIRQMLTNLAINARDAMPEGGTLCFALARVKNILDDLPANSLCTHLFLEPSPQSELDMQAKEWIQLVVSDSGTGIAPDVLPHIFEPFFTTKASGAGSGLGLSQVYGIVKHHEGYIDVATEVGTGTVFTIYLPALQLSPEEVSVMSIQNLFPGQGETILLVEDEAVLRHALAESLTALNYRVLEAIHGREALTLLEQYSEEIVLVLSDMVMPEMGGQALFYALQQRGLAMPMVIMSGHPMENELEQLQSQGLAGWMLKPLSMEQLSQLLARLLRPTV